MNVTKSNDNTYILDDPAKSNRPVLAHRKILFGGGGQIRYALVIPSLVIQDQVFYLKLIKTEGNLL